MPLRYSCFISYCHGQEDLMSGFMDQLTAALKSSLEPYLDEEIFRDKERLQPGFSFSQAIPKALCESVCMVMVFVPKYLTHPYCRRELAAMYKLQQERFQKLGTAAPADTGLIIPILLRGRADDLPSKIKDHTLFCDFSHYSTATGSIREKPDFVAEIDKMADFIYNQYQLLQAAHDPHHDCAQFKLPEDSQVGDLATPSKPRAMNPQPVGGSPTQEEPAGPGGGP